MPMVSRFSSFLRNLFRRPAVERQLDAELRAHVALLTDENIKRGMDPGNARRAALLEVGGVEQVKEQVRDVRTGAFFETLLHDVRYGLRMLRKTPGFTAAAALALALGIGANAALFSVVYALLLQPLPYKSADRLAVLYISFSPQNNPHGQLSMADFLDWKSQNRSLEEMAAFAGARFDLTGGGEPEQIIGANVTANFFSTLEVQPILGRTFRTGEDSPGANPVAVISETLWKRRFGANSSAIGEVINLNGQPYTVVGVMPSSFRLFGPNSEIWTILTLNPPKRRGPYFMRGLGRLKPGVTLKQAQAEANSIGARIEHDNPDYKRLTFPVVGLREAIVGNVRPALLVMFGAVVLVLLIATVNVANLLLSRASTREREMAVRLSMGASRARLLRQLLTESVLLAALGGTAGILLASWLINLFRTWGWGNIPRATYIRLDGHVLAFTCIISLLSGILFGLVPAFQSSRADLNSALKEGGRSGTQSASRRRTHAALVVSEIALSLMLLIGAGLLLRSFVLLQQVNPGFSFPPESILTMRISASGASYADPAKSVALFGSVLERVRQLPGVEVAAVSDSLPPDREGDSDTFVIQGQVFRGGELNPSTTHPSVSDLYFTALGIPLIRGRYFTEHDTAVSPPVTIVSETFARRYFPDQDPIGKRIKASGPGLTELPYMEIVGIVGNAKYIGLENGDGSAYYQPFSQNVSQRAFLTVRSALPAAQLVPQLRREIHNIAEDVVINGESTMEQALSDSVAMPRFRTILLGLFAVLALLLAAIGIYGVIAYSVAQRTHEIGIRMALGARQVDVLTLIMGQGARLAAIGLAVGLVGALALTRMLSTMLFAIRPTDPLTFAGVSLMLAAVALIASLIPAARASRIDPVIALRDE
jgi:predicted permease